VTLALVASFFDFGAAIGDEGGDLIRLRAAEISGVSRFRLRDTTVFEVVELLEATLDILFVVDEVSEYVNFCSTPDNDLVAR
jgi:hypothetical protein